MQRTLFSLALMALLSLIIGCGDASSPNNAGNGPGENAYGDSELLREVTDIAQRNDLFISDPAQAQAVHLLLAQTRVRGEVKAVAHTNGFWQVTIHSPSVLPYDDSPGEAEIASNRQIEIEQLLQNYGAALTILVGDEDVAFFSPQPDAAAVTALVGEIVSISLRAGFSAQPALTASQARLSRNNQTVGAYATGAAASVGCTPRASGCSAPPATACFTGTNCGSIGATCQTSSFNRTLTCCLNPTSPSASGGIGLGDGPYWKVSACQCPNSRPIPVRRGNFNNECCPFGADTTVPGCACPSGQGVRQGRCQVCPAGEGVNASGDCAACPANQVGINGVCQSCPVGQSVVNGHCVFAGPAKIDVFAEVGNFTCPGTNTFTWTSTNASACRLEYLGDILDPLSNPVAVRSWNVAARGSLSLSVNDMTPPLFSRAGPNLRAFRLTCFGGGSSDSQAKYIDVNAVAPSIPNLDINPQNVLVEGSVNVNWTSTNASACRSYFLFPTAAGTQRVQVGGTRSTSGSFVLSNMGNGIPSPITGGMYQYTLEMECDAVCPGQPAMTHRKEIMVRDLMPPMVNVNTPTIFNNQPATVSWTAEAGECEVTNGAGTVIASGQPNVGQITRTFQRPANWPVTSPYDYVVKVVCRLPGGHFSPPGSGAVNIGPDMPPTISTFLTTPSMITVGQSTTLSWTSNGATCRVYNRAGALVTQGLGIDSKVVNFNITIPTSPYHYELILRCEGSSGLLSPDYPGGVMIQNNP